MPSLEQLYRQVDNLSGLKHPTWQRGFHYMSDRSAVALAEALVDKIMTSNIQRVMVAETGASPIAEIAERISLYKADKLRHKQVRALSWRRVKFPRDPIANIFATLTSFMTDHEKSVKLTPEQVSQLTTNALAVNLGITESFSRAEALTLVCQNMPADFFQTDKANIADLLDCCDSARQTEFQAASSIIFENTEIAREFAEPVVYFDEYIDSGTTFRNALTFFKCFAQTPRVRTASYYISLPEARSHKNVIYTHWTLADKPNCYQEGAYPYENRVDLIGHYYCVTEHTHLRTDVVSIFQEFRDADQSRCQDIVTHLFEVVSNRGLLTAVYEKLELPEIRNYVNAEHVVRYCLYHLERKLGKPEYAEFLFQLFDMYGPAWSPMPVSFHFDFWKGFDGLDSVFESISEFEGICTEYKQARSALFKGAAHICLTRRKTWLLKVHNLLEELYGQRDRFINSSKGSNSGVYSRPGH